jgi:hypothetical protein
VTAQQGAAARVASRVGVVFGQNGVPLSSSARPSFNWSGWVSQGCSVDRGVCPWAHLTLTLQVGFAVSERYSAGSAALPKMRYDIVSL